MKVSCLQSAPPLGALFISAHIKSSSSIDITFDGNAKEASVQHPDGSKYKYGTASDLCRLLARLGNAEDLLGRTALEKSEVDSWLCFSAVQLNQQDEFAKSVAFLNRSTAQGKFLVGEKVSAADYMVLAAIVCNPTFKPADNLLLWFNRVRNLPAVKKAVSASPDVFQDTLVNAQAQTADAGQRKLPEQGKAAGERAQEGKFVDLPGAEMGKVVVRFPPEASGYLHIGHAKAALLNQYYQQAFEGRLIMRFDDTNPAKEDVHFEQVILGDVAMLDIKPDLFTHTSQYFDLMLEYCEQLLKNGDAYVDDTEPEQMKTEREGRVESANRNNAYEKNLKMWQEMKAGSKSGQKSCVRAKIDMQSPNGCLRDPTIYRCKNEPHPRTGTKYKVYPTYDFACPIVDAIEDVTHTLRTMEYHDRDAQFYWFIEKLGLRRPYIWEYSRLSMTNTVLSKRKLTWFVQEGYVDGWDDPRMPTVRGVLRRGMTVEGLKQFIIAQGSSRSVVFMEWDKIWAFNKKVIDPIAPRFTALDFNSTVEVKVRGVKTEKISVAKHPKNAEVGLKDVWISDTILIEMADALQLKENENTTFINWGNLLIKKINKENGVIKSIDAEPNLDNKDYKKTLKLTFLAKVSDVKFTSTYCVYFDHLISKALLGKDEDFKQFIATDTRKEVQMLGDPELKKLKQGDIIQLQRIGFFRVDVAFEEANPFTCREQPVVLFYVPDGHTKDSPNVNVAKTAGKTEEKQPSPQKTTSNSRTASTIDTELNAQADLVRDLKAKKASKADIDAAVKLLLALKVEYKTVTGNDWKQGAAPPTSVPEQQSAQTVTSQHSSATINADLNAQADLVRDLKAKKASKADIDAAVKLLLTLKVEYKTATGNDWKQGAVPPPPTSVTEQPSSNRSSATINAELNAQADLVRDLKAKKAPKLDLDTAVKHLLALKAEYKTASGTDWKQGAAPSTSVPEQQSAQTVTSQRSSSTINAEINAQADFVRNLKAMKAPQLHIDTSVKHLLALKAEYKTASGMDWKQGAAPPTSVSEQPSVQRTVASERSSSTINAELNAQADLVRDLKAKKAPKAELDAAVKLLLALKVEYKTATGTDWKQGAVVPAQVAMSAPATGDSGSADQLIVKVNTQGEVVRTLKSKNAAKDEIDAAVKQLLSLKAEYKTLTGKDVPAAGRANQSKENKPKEAKKEKSKPEKAKENSPPVNKDSKEDDSSQKKQTRLCIEAKKEEALSNWYSEVITKGEMIEYYDVSGCYILRPWSFSIWDAIREWFDAEIKKLGVQNCYFPIFVSKAVLEKEKTHIADFAPEVAWVTRSGNSEMAEPIAVRPTSETVMYPAYAKWIQSHRDLPIKLNQWNNVVRWEFSNPQPFLRTREFLWQEGHTAHATAEAAQEEVRTILELYARVYTDLLAVPVIRGRKTEKEKFAGGDYTTTVEAYVSASGRAVQGATSHFLGQNFSRMFDITFEVPGKNAKNYVEQNSWGISTRTIGVMIMVHGDNTGLVLPPRVAQVQAVIVPCGITAKSSDSDRNNLQNNCTKLEEELRAAGVRVKGDYRENQTPGWKYSHWELKGVPIRIEYGPKDIEKNQLVAVRRDTGEKLTIQRNTAVKDIQSLLENIHQNLYNKALKDMESHTVVAKSWDVFCSSLDKKNIILAPFCGGISCEEKIKAESARTDAADVDPGAPSMGGKSLCIPFEQPAEIEPSDKCIHPACTSNPKFYTLFGRSY